MNQSTFLQGAGTYQLEILGVPRGLSYNLQSTSTATKEISLVHTTKNILVLFLGSTVLALKICLFYSLLVNKIRAMGSNLANQILLCVSLLSCITHSRSVITLQVKLT